jgi:hypothetical protein
VKIIEKAKYIRSGETVLDRCTPFTIKEVRVSAEDGGIVFIDMEGVGHGTYHPDEYFRSRGRTRPQVCRDLRLANSRRVLPIA